MKRGAEKQLSKDDGDEEASIPVDEGSEGQIGMKKADEAKLAGRKMRSLPKRSSLAPMAPASPTKNASASTVEQESGKPSTFGGFGGFGGSTASASSPFSFTPTPPLGASLTASKSAPTIGSASPSPPLPASQATATNVESTPEYKYYAALRGLNVSFLAAAKRTIEKDPFADISELLEKYKGLRLDAKKNLDSVTASTSKAAPAPVKMPSMPSVPTAFAGFKAAEKSGTRDSTTKTIQPAPGGFTPTLGTPSSPFSFASTSSASLKEAPPTSAASKASPFEFRAPTQLPSKTAEGETPLAVSPFGVKPPSPAKTTNYFNLGASSSSPAKDTPASTNPFGQSTMLFGNKNTSVASPGTPKKETSNPFATSSSTSPGSNPFGTPSTPGSFGGFGGFKKSPGGGSGSLGNPVGFGFGAANKAGAEESDAAKKPASSFSFAFGATPIGAPAKVDLEPPAPVPGASATSTTEEESGEAEADNNADAEAKTPSLIGKNPHDEEGEGEEDEQTVHSVKLQVYRMQDNAWANLGAGVLRVKKHNTDDSRRLLLRNSSTGKININFKLYSGFQSKLQKKSLTFVGHDAGEKQMYMVRPKTEEQAKELTEVLEREIEFVKAKSDV